MTGVALVTGGAGGIGGAVVARLAADGWTVTSFDRAAGASHTVDVTSDAAVGAGVAAVLATHGRIDLLVTAAGVTTGRPLHETDPAGWHAVLDANLTSVYLCARHVLPAMVAAGSGVIVTIGSVLARTTAPGLPAYAAAKGAVVALTRQLAVDYGRHGIRCVTISPGWIRTPATESRLDDAERQREATPGATRLGEPADVAAAVAYAAGAPFLTGTEIVLDGGASAVSPASLLRPGPRAALGLPPLG